MPFTTFVVYRDANAEPADDLSVSMDAVGLDLWDITVVSKTDALTVTGVAINRGNCKGTVEGARLPRVMHFGESLRYRLDFCHPIEATIETNNRSEVFDFGAPVGPGTQMNVSADVYADNGYHNTMTLTSYVDLVLSRVTINRGNCGPFGDRRVDPPQAMHFGDYYVIRSFPCRPIEVTAATDKGPITFEIK